jgi:hypothetical protein
VQKGAEEKTGKHYTFRTEEMLLQHVQTILEATVPLRDVLSGALNEATIKEAILALQSGYEYVKNHISEQYRREMRGRRKRREAEEEGLEFRA